MYLTILLFLAASAEPPGWMAGCWSGQVGPMTFEEQWTRPAGGSMMGIARTLKGDRVVFSEFMRIDTRGGQMVYTPRIGTRSAPVEFTLKSSTADEVVFENAAHDFPQRIVYRRVPGGLHARIEGMDKGNARSDDFPMKSRNCGGID